MRVQGNDDSYAAAWKRMASAVAAAERAERVQRPQRPDRQERLKWLTRLQRAQRPAPPAARPQQAPASVTLLPDEPPLKKRRTFWDRRAFSPSSGYATTSSSERQAEDSDDERTSSIERSSCIQRRYPPISSDLIRQHYINDCAKLYPEYMSLYARLAQVAALFSHLEVELHSAVPLAVAGVEQQIRDEYRRLKSDPRYVEDRARYNYLHAKVTHLKLMVCHYDTMQPGRVP